MNTYKIRLYQNAADLQLLISVLKALPVDHHVRLDVESALFRETEDAKSAVEAGWAVYNGHMTVIASASGTPLQ